MSSTPPLNHFGNRVLAFTLGSVCLSPKVGTEAWSEDDQPQSFMLQEIFVLTLMKPYIIEFTKASSKKKVIPPHAIRALLYVYASYEHFLGRSTL